MEVLHVSPIFGATSGFGGMASSSESLCAELAKLGVDITVIAPDNTARFRQTNDNRPNPEDKNRFETILLPVTARLFERFTGMYFTPHFLSAYNRQASMAGLVHFHGFRSYQNFAAFRTTLKRRIRYIIQPHGSAIRGFGKSRLKQLYDHILGTEQATHARALIASTPAEALQLQSLGIVPTKIRTIPNGVHKESWAASPKSPTLFRDALRLPEGQQVVLFVGRLDSTKGLNLLINAFGLAATRIPEATLVLIGPDFGMRTTLQTLVRQLGLSGRVVFAGPGSQEIVHAAYKQSSVVVISSTYESFSLVALEAAASGTPVLMTAACGLSPAFEKAGLTIANPNVHSMSNAISRLIQDEAFRRSQKAALCKLPWETFSWPEIARTVLALYQDVLRT